MLYTRRHFVRTTAAAALLAGCKKQVVTEKTADGLTKIRVGYIGITCEAPLFSAMLNYRHGSQADEEQRQALQGIETLDSNERSNYPLSLSVDDIGERFRLVTLAPAAVGAARVCEQMRRVLEAMPDDERVAAARAFDAFARAAGVQPSEDGRFMLALPVGQEPVIPSFAGD